MAILEQATGRDPTARLRITFLGTGTSTGVPMLGCRCPVCTSRDPRDRRLRSSVLLEYPGITAVIDTTPEFRIQMLRAGAHRLDAVLLTHHHADHLNGLDDVRQYTLGTKRRIPVYGPPEALAWVRSRFSYIWQNVQAGGGVPQIDLLPVFADFHVGPLPVTVLRVFHGILPIYGYRVGDFAYISDVSAIPESTFQRLRGVRILVLDAVRYRPHSTHFHVEAAVTAARRVGAERTYLTHMNHDIRHARLEQELPGNIQPAYDGLVLELAYPATPAAAAVLEAEG